MNRQPIIVAVLVGVLGGATFQALTAAQADGCGIGAAGQLRTTLYFGTHRATGPVTELEWGIFLRDEVTARFPDGLTAWDAHGQWRAPKGDIAQERAKILLIVHPDSQKARASIMDLIGRYRKAFEQQSVLWETSKVCVTM